jgi:UDP-GlcNAc:undecaprenyl-phosphate/decaprenyl-phosphate GlcNAc-1-phosphate transferase
MKDLSGSLAALTELPVTDLVAGFVLSLALSAILTRWVIASGPVDRPRDRGAHDNPTPTSGGMAVMAACALAVGIVLVHAGPVLGGFAKPALWLFGFAILIGLSGAADDVLGLPAKVRFAFQALCALGFAAAFPVTDLDFGFGLDLHLWRPLGIAGTALWLITVVNAVNFIDGANGLAPGAQSVALSGLCLLMMLFAPAYQIPGMAVLGLLLMCALGANLGFLPFNLPMGKLFQGDAGSLFSAALIGGAVPILHTSGYGSIWFGGYILAPVLVDVILTLIIRWRAGERLFEAHKRHLYQQWLIRRGGSHAQVSTFVWGLCALSGGLGLVMEYLYRNKGIDLRFAELAVLVGVLSLGWWRLRLRIGADQPAPPQSTHQPSDAA